MNKKISSPNAPAAIGPYSQAILAGDTLYVSGQLGLIPSSGQFPEGGIEAQARQSLNNIKSILEAAGFKMSDVVKTTCLLADIADFAAFNSIYAEFLGEVAPARSAFAAKALPKGGLVEIEAVAVRH